MFKVFTIFFPHLKIKYEMFSINVDENRFLIPKSQAFFLKLKKLVELKSTSFF